MNANSSTRLLRYMSLVLLVGVVLIRLVIILWAGSIPDADECVVGLMARHIANDGAHPLYFYGQGYAAGAGLESHLLVVVFYVFGSSAVSFQVTGLFLWIGFLLVSWRVGGFFLGPRSGYISLMLMACAPGMAEWGMKLRGGYLPALLFLVCAAWISFKLMGRKEKQFSAAGLTLVSFLVGISAGLAAWSQPVAFPAALAIMLLALIAAGPAVRTVPPMLSGALLILLAAFMLSPGHTMWHPGFSSPAESVNTFIRLFTHAIPRFFTPYLDSVAFGLRADEIAVAALWCLGLSTALIWSWVRIARVRGHRARALLLINVVVLATLLGCAAVSADSLEPRHLLALYPFYCLVIAAGLDALWQNRGAVAVIVLGILVVSGLWINLNAARQVDFHNPYSGQKLGIANLERVIDHLKERGVRHVFCADPEYKWNLIFLSSEQIVARSYNPDDRYPAYVERVNEAVKAGLPTAVVIPLPDSGNRPNLVRGLLEHTDEPVVEIDEEVLIIFGVPKDILFSFFPERLE